MWGGEGVGMGWHHFGIILGGRVGGLACWLVLLLVLRHMCLDVLLVPGHMCLDILLVPGHMCLDVLLVPGNMCLDITETRGRTPYQHVLGHNRDTGRDTPSTLVVHLQTPYEHGSGHQIIIKMCTLYKNVYLCNLSTLSTSTFE